MNAKEHLESMKRSRAPTAPVGHRVDNQLEEDLAATFKILEREPQTSERKVFEALRIQASDPKSAGRGSAYI